MSNEVALFGGAVPAHLQGQSDDLTKSLMGGSNSKRISIKGGVFRMLVAGKEVAQNTDRAMDVVIVNAAEKNSRSYYAANYDNNAKATPPDCWSDDGTTPSKQAKNPQHRSCQGCPQDIKGSGQGESRACRYSRRVAVVLANDIKGEVYALSLPAASVFGDDPKKLGMQGYARYLAAHNASINTVVTEMRFDTDVATPKLMFKAKRWLTPEEFDVVKVAKESPDALAAIALSVHQIDKVGGKGDEIPGAALPQGATTTQPAPEHKPTANQDAAPRARVADKPTEKRDAQAVLKEWADSDD